MSRVTVRNGRRSLSRTSGRVQRAAWHVVEGLEMRCLLGAGAPTGAGSAPLTTTQERIIAGLPEGMHGEFAGPQLELSRAASSKVSTPNFVLIDPAPSLSQGGTLLPCGGTGPYGLTPAQMRHAYGIDNIKFGSIIGDGTGQTIAIIDAYDYPTAWEDLQAFDQQFGLPDPPSFTKVNQTGGSVLPDPDPSPKGSTWALEAALDIEWTHAMAPAANIILVEANSAFDCDLITAAVGWARSAPGVSAISMSFGRSETSDEAAVAAGFSTPAGHGGVTFLAATGDHGAPGIFPSCSPNVLAVGGTTLSVDAAGNRLDETGWTGSGGGISKYAAQPTYQQGIVTQSASGRAIPDVAFDADPYSGASVYDSYDFGVDSPWITVGGTSLSSPAFAGLIAIANQGRALGGATSLDGPTQTLPTLYSLPSSCFNDITSGQNGYAAGPGYDLVTGLGSPVADVLVPRLAVSGPYVTGFAPSSLQTTAPSFVTFTFSTAMNPASFSVGSDVASFTGPGGVDLRSSITGFSWLNANKTLRVNFAPQSAQGAYTMTIGPQILSGTGMAMDQNRNALSGEAALDQYAGTFHYASPATLVAFTSPASGASVPPPFTSLDVHFSAPVSPDSVSATSLVLSQGKATAAEMIDSTTVRYTLSGILQGGAITVKLAEGSLLDMNGNPTLAFTGTYNVPAAAPPGAPVLDAGYDTGVSSSDGITSFDNSAGKAMTFTVAGTIAGDMVALYADGALIGSATATSTTTTITTDGTTPLRRGSHTFRARQGVFGGQSADSPATTITVLNTPVTLPGPGRFDSTLNGTGISITPQLVGYGAYGSAVQADGKVVMSGAALYPGDGSTSAAVVRYDTSGQLDPSFGTGGYVITRLGAAQVGRSVVVQPDGKIVVVVSSMDIAVTESLQVVRYNADGTLDSTFGTGGIATIASCKMFASGITRQADGSFIVAGDDGSVGELVKLTVAGKLDTSFHNTGYITASFGGYSFFKSAVVASDGKILAVGSISAAGPYNTLVARYTPSGALDTSFNGTGYAVTPVGVSFSNVRGLVLQPDGKLVVSAVCGSGVALARYRSDGTLDSGFGAGGIVTWHGIGVSAPVLQKDGKLVVVGSYDYNDITMKCLSFVARFNADGSRDTAFADNGMLITSLGSAIGLNDLHTVAIKPDGRIIAGGYSHDEVVPRIQEWTIAQFDGGDATPALDPASDSGTSSSDAITNVATPSFDLPVVPGLYARIYRDGVLVSAPYVSGSIATVLSAQPAGTSSYAMSFVDAAGNESPRTAACSVTLDAAPPAAGSFAGAPLSAATGNYTFRVTYSDAISIVSSSVDGADILVTDGGAYRQLATLVSATPAGNASSITATYRVTPPAGGWGAAGTKYMFGLQDKAVSDMAGNATGAAALGTVSVIAATPPGRPVLEGASDSGVSSSDGVTNLDNCGVKVLQFTVPGTLAGATVTIYVDGVATGSAMATGGSTLVFTSGTQALGNGPHAITARQTWAGQESDDSPAATITIDTMGPTGVVVGPLVAAGANYRFNVRYSDANGVDVSTLDSRDLIVNNATGYFQYATFVSASRPGNGSPIVATYEVPPPAGGWASGSASYNVIEDMAQIGDIAGNFAPVASAGMLAPKAGGSAPGQPTLAASTDSGVAGDRITNFDNSSAGKALQFSVSSTVAGDTVTIYADGKAIGSAVATFATTVVTTDGTTALGDGVHIITARRAATGGIASADSAVLSLTVDTIAARPAAPVLDSSADKGAMNNDGVTNLLGPTVDVTTAEAGRVYLQIDGPDGPVISKDATGAGVVTIPALSTPGFRALPVLSTGYENGAVVAGDFNGDGKQDLVVMASGGLLLPGNGDGTFSPPTSLHIAWDTQGLRTADFNNDGKPDLLVPHLNNFDVYLGNGDGTFTAKPYFAAANGGQLCLADINGDGKTDLIAASGNHSSTFSVWLGNGDGTFQAPYTVPAGFSVHYLAVGDVNGDGRPDVVAVSESLRDWSMSAMINGGNNTFAAPAVTPLTEFGPCFVTLADFDSDGKADVMIGNTSDHEQVSLSNGEGSFKAPVAFVTNFNSRTFTTGDFNRDGNVDVVVGNNMALYVLYGNGDGTMQPPVMYSLASVPADTAVADINGDGAPDLVLVSSLLANNVSVFCSTGGAIGAGTHSLRAWFTDLAGNTSALSAPATIVIDQTPPTADSFVGPAFTTPATAPHTFSVTFRDAAGIDTASLGEGDLVVTGPNGYLQAAALVSTTSGPGGASVVATYQVPAPATGWDFASGAYTASLQSGQVLDAAGNANAPVSWAMANTASRTVQAEDFDAGGEGVGCHDAEIANLGGQYRADGPDIEMTTDTGGGYDVGYVKAGEWLNYTLSVANAGLYTLDVRVASGAAGGVFHLAVDGVNKTGAIAVPNTGGWQKWQTVTKSIDLPAGRHVLRLVFDTASTAGFVGNFNWLRLAPVLAPAPPATVTASDSTYIDKVRVTWSTVAGATGYDVYRGTTNDSSTCTLVGSSSTTSFDDSTAVAGTPYYYWVIAKNAAGASGYSASDVGTRTAPPPPRTTYPNPPGTAWVVPSSGSATIQVENFDTGGEGVAYHDLTSANQGGAYRTSDGVDIEAISGSAGAYAVDYTQAGEWMEYTANVATSGTYSIGFSVASAGKPGGTFHLNVDGANVTGAMSVPQTNAWNAYSVVTKAGVSLTAGQHVLRLVMDSVGGSGYAGNLNWMQFTAQAPPTPALSISDVSQSEGNSGVTPLTFNIVLSQQPSSPVSVHWATADGTATVADGDYAATSGDVTFNPGDALSQQVTVYVNGDTTAEANESFTVALSGAVGANLSKAVGTGTIVNDDGVTRTTYPTPPGTPWAIPAAGSATIQLENFDTGGEGVAYHDLTSANQGGAYRTGDGVDIEAITGSAGAYAVDYTQAGEWMEYTANVAASGAYSLSFRAASAGKPGGTFHLNVDGVNVTGAMSVPQTSAWNAYATVTKAGVSLTAGQHILRLVMDSAGGSGYVGNFDSMQFSVPAKSTPFSGTPIAAPGLIEAENFDLGGEGVAYHDTETANQGGKYRTDGVDIEATADTGGAYDVGWTKAGEWMAYNVSIATAGVFSLQTRIAAAGTGGAFHVEFDGVNVTGSIAAPNTGGWQTWQTIGVSGISLTAGQHVMKVVMEKVGASGYVGNFNWFAVG